MLQDVNYTQPVTPSQGPAPGVDGNVMGRAFSAPVYLAPVPLNTGAPTIPQSGSPLVDQAAARMPLPGPSQDAISQSITQASVLLAQPPAVMLGIRRQESNTHLAQAIRTGDPSVDPALQYISAEHQALIAQAFDVLGHLNAPTNRLSVAGTLSREQRLGAVTEMEQLRGAIDRRFVQEEFSDDPQVRNATLSRITHDLYAAYGVRDNYCDESARLMYQELTQRGMSPLHLVNIGASDNRGRGHSLMAYLPRPTASFGSNGAAAFPMVTLDAWVDRPYKLTPIENLDALRAHLRHTMDAVYPVQGPCLLRLDFI